MGGSKMSMVKFEVGKPFPGPYPVQEGAAMELWKSGLVVFCQFPGCTREERQAFKKSFKRYAYLEPHTETPVAVWVFMFPEPFNAIDVNFDASRVEQDLIDWYLDNTGGVKSLVTFYLLDGPILQGIKAVGLDPEAVKLFQETIKKQRYLGYSKWDFDNTLRALYSYGTDELYQMGRKFKK